MDTPDVDMVEATLVGPPPRRGVTVDAHIVDDIMAAGGDAEDTLATRVRAVRPELANHVGSVAEALAPIRGSERLWMGVEVDIGRDEKVSIATFLRRIQQRKDAVCLLRTSAGTATAFLVAPDIVMTNNHAFTGKQRILATEAHARGAVATFNYDGEEDEGAPTDAYELAPERGFFASTALDYALCRTRGSPGARWGVLELSDAADIAVGDDVYIIQHPRGRPKQLAAAGNVVTLLDPPVIQYTTDTLRGSSGAPVFDFEWRLIALHHANREHVSGGRTFYRNEGYLSTAILRDLARGPEIARVIVGGQ